MGVLARVGTEPAAPTQSAADDDHVRLLRPRPVDLVHVEAVTSGVQVATAGPDYGDGRSLRDHQPSGPEILEREAHARHLPVRAGCAGEISYGGTASAVTTAEALAATSDAFGERPADDKEAASPLERLPITAVRDRAP